MLAKTSSIGFRSPLAGGNISKTDILTLSPSHFSLSHYDEQDILNKKYCQISNKHYKFIAYLQYLLWTIIEMGTTIGYDTITSLRKPINIMLRINSHINFENDIEWDIIIGFWLLRCKQLQTQFLLCLFFRYQNMMIFHLCCPI